MRAKKAQEEAEKLKKIAEKKRVKSFKNLLKIPTKNPFKQAKSITIVKLQS